MFKRIGVLAIVPLLLAALGFGGRTLMEHSWDELVDYQSQYAAALPVGEEREALTDQVVIILQDGLRVDVSTELETWNALRAQGADLTVRTGQPSLSIPSFSVINTGAYQEISGVTTNWYESPIPPLDSVYCEAQRKGLTTAMVQEAEGTKLFAPCLDLPIFPKVPDDRRAADDIILREGLVALQEEPNLLWIHFSGSDWSGHHYGGTSEEYRVFAREIDTRIAEIAEAMDLDSSVLILHADHGHIDTGGHGGWEEEVVRTPLVFAGEGIEPGAYPEVEQASIAPTVAALLVMAIPTHNQGQPIFDLLDIPLQVGAELAVDVAHQHRHFYNQYLIEIGTGTYAGDQLAEADEALAQGDYQRAYETGSEFASAIRRHANGAKEDRFWRERLARLPVALLILLIPAVYLLLCRQKRELVIPLIGAGIYFLLYNGCFFLRGHNWSISAFNEEVMIPAFLAQRVMEAAISLLVATLVVGALMRERTAFETGKAAVDTSFFVGLGLLLQVDLFYWLYSFDFGWCLPNLRWGLKYYFDLLQLFPTGLAALVAPFIAIAVKSMAGRLIPAGTRQEGVAEPRVDNCS
jgi:hypothetical protein